MCSPDAAHAVGDAFGAATGRGFTDASDALAMAGVAMDYLNAAVADLDGAACGELLIALGEVQAKLTAAHAGLLRRFDAADAHDVDGYGSSSSWLAAKAQLTRKDARAAVREMRRLGERPRLDAALASGDITRSWALAIADWTRKLPGPEATVPRGNGFTTPCGWPARCSPASDTGLALSYSRVRHWRANSGHP